jgi:hypothetical protein
MAMVAGIGLLTGLTMRTLAQPTSAPPKLEGAALEKEACQRNLKVIYEAIQAYRLDHKDLPEWLSDLVPKYLADANVLNCPVCLRTGQTEAPPLADPKLPSSYLYEFSPVPLWKATTNAPPPTRRELHRRQMGLVGSIVPLVRCRLHNPMLNLAFDGRIYESPAAWETVVTNLVRLADLNPPRIFADGPRPGGKGGGKGGKNSRFPARDSDMPTTALDLTAFYNAGLNDSWQGGTSNNLQRLSKGRRTMAGVEFDVRGIIQLGSQSPSTTNFPALVTGIPVKQKCRRLCFLHAAGFGTAGDEGKQIGKYLVHFATSQMRLEIPIRYGREVRNWHSVPGEPPAPMELVVAWRSDNPASKSQGQGIRLFLTQWTNVAPDVEIESIDFISNMAEPAPFVIAISAE